MTPIVAIAPLIIIWVKDATLSLVVCATLMAVFPIISNTTQGLRSVSPGLLSYFRLNHASRWQTLVRLRIPSALPYFFGALRISSGLSLIGAVVAEFVAGTGGTNTGLAYQILQAGYQLDIPLMFAALLLISRRYRAVWRDVLVSRRALSARMKAKPCNLINVLLTNRKRMMTDEQRQHAVAAIQQALPALEWTLQPAKIKRLSRDFHWFSPLLTEQLAGKQADAVVRPRDEEELRQLVCACAQHQLPLTLRGSATGNYGQLVPLEGGLLVDMTGLNQIVALGNGTVRAQAGIRGGHRNRRPPDGLGAALYAIDLSTGEPGRSLRRRVRRYRLHQLWAAGGARQCAQRQSDDRRAGPPRADRPGSRSAAAASRLRHQRHYPGG